MLVGKRERRGRLFGDFLSEVQLRYKCVAVDGNWVIVDMYIFKLWLVKPPKVVVAAFCPGQIEETGIARGYF